MLVGKKNKRFEENKLAEMVAMVGTYMKYASISSDMEKFEEYYADNIGNKKFYYSAQRKVDANFREHLKEKGISYSARKMRRFYRYNNSRKPKIELILSDYFDYVMNYIESNDILKKINTCRIIVPCYNFTEKESEPKSYDSCLQYILAWYYDRISSAARGILCEEKKKEIAKQLLGKLENNKELNDFYCECRMIHTQK